MQAVQAHLTAESASWSGAETVEANVLALRYVTAESIPWNLGAAQLHVETVTTGAHVVLPAVAWADLEPSHETETYQNATLTGHTAAENHFLYATKLRGANAPALHVACVQQLAGYREDVLQVPDQVQRPNPNPVLATGSSLHSVACAELSWCGSFRVALWSWHAAGTHSGGAFELETGRHPAKGNNVVVPATQAYLTVIDGCLVLPQGAELVANEVEVAGAAIRLHRPAGVVAGLNAAGQELVLEGDFTAKFQRTTPDDQLASIIEGDIEHAAVDDFPILLQPGSKFGWAFIGTVLASLVGVGSLLGALSGPVQLLIKHRFATSNDETSQGYWRPYRSRHPVKTLRFLTIKDQELARLLETHRQLVGGRMNDLLLRLLRRGLQAELQDRKANR